MRNPSKRPVFNFRIPLRGISLDVSGIESSEESAKLDKSDYVDLFGVAPKLRCTYGITA